MGKKTQTKIKKTKDKIKSKTQTTSIRKRRSEVERLNDDLRVYEQFKPPNKSNLRKHVANHITNKVSHASKNIISNGNNERILRRSSRRPTIIRPERIVSSVRATSVQTDISLSATHSWSIRLKQKSSNHLTGIQSIGQESENTTTKTPIEKYKIIRITSSNESQNSINSNTNKENSKLKTVFTNRKSISYTPSQGSISNITKSANSQTIPPESLQTDIENQECLESTLNRNEVNELNSINLFDYFHNFPNPLGTSPDESFNILDNQNLFSCTTNTNDPFIGLNHECQQLSQSVASVSDHIDQALAKARPHNFIFGQPPNDIPNNRVTSFPRRERKSPKDSITK